MTKRDNHRTAAVSPWGEKRENHLTTALPPLGERLAIPHSRESRVRGSLVQLEPKLGNGWLILLILLPLLTLFPACLVGPNYNRPKVNAPAVFRGAEGAAQQASLADLPWWEVFKDETLKGLVKKALANNYDLLVAVSRIEQARQIEAQAHSQFLPSVGYQTTISGGKNESAGSILPFGG